MRFVSLPTLVALSLASSLAYWAEGADKNKSTPAASSESARSEVSDGLMLASTLRPAVTEVFLSEGHFPRNNEAAGVPPPAKLISNYVAQVTIENGAIHIVYGNRANSAITGKTLTMRPATVDGSPASPMTWVCGYAQPVSGMSAEGANRTSVSAEYLPPICRK